MKSDKNYNLNKIENNFQYKYPNLSLGYIGEFYNRPTINSKFYYLILQDFEILNNTICFPQRIPKSGYFQELTKLEKKFYYSRFNKIIKLILHELEKAILKKQSKKIINIFKLMLRYSLFKEIQTYHIPDENTEIVLEINLIKSIARFEEELSLDNPRLDLDNFINLLSRVDNKQINTSLNIQIINRVIVYYYRFQANSIDKNLISNLLKQHIDDVFRLPNDFNSQILKSIAFRGIAMANELGQTKQSEFLTLSEKIARNIQPTLKIEALVKKDNLFTCLQTLSKWNIFQRNYTKTEEILNEMCELDPHDSVAYCEMGIFLKNQGRFLEAEKYFNKAVQLGPPGVGMNSYFRAKCLEHLSQTNEAVNQLYLAASIDEEAISPLLDLFNQYKNNIHDKAKQIARRITNSPALKNQLDISELNELLKYLD